MSKWNHTLPGMPAGVEHHDVSRERQAKASLYCNFNRAVVSLAMRRYT